MTTSFAPGRVNLIGEHIDYHGLPVLPMALRRGIRLDFEPVEIAEVSLANRDPAFGARRFPLTGDPTPGPEGDWGNYAMAAMATVVRRWGVGRGIRGTLGSDLPPAAGLSSSSALVVAVARALLHANDVSAEPLELAELLAEGERFVGTAGGGMDQAASLMGREGHAVRLEFGPLRASPVPLPEDWAVLVAHTGVSAEKSGSAQAAYNARRRESTRALSELAAALGTPGAAPVTLLEEHDVASLLAELRRHPGPGLEWAEHALTEAGRVAEAEAALRSADLTTFGVLLNASHASLRDRYQVSHPRLDALVEAACQAGAAGARLTGAGFGGCMLAVCEGDAVDDVAAALARAQKAMDPPVELAPFRAEAGAGARILD